MIQFFQLSEPFLVWEPTKGRNWLCQALGEVLHDKSNLHFHDSFLASIHTQAPANWWDWKVYPSWVTFEHRRASVSWTLWPSRPLKRRCGGQDGRPTRGVRCGHIQHAFSSMFYTCPWRPAFSSCGEVVLASSSAMMPRMDGFRIFRCREVSTWVTHGSTISFEKSVVSLDSQTWTSLHGIHGKRWRKFGSDNHLIYIIYNILYIITYYIAKHHVPGTPVESPEHRYGSIRCRFGCIDSWLHCLAYPTEGLPIFAGDFGDQVNLCVQFCCLWLCLVEIVATNPFPDSPQSTTCYIQWWCVKVEDFHFYFSCLIVIQQICDMSNNTKHISL